MFGLPTLAETALMLTLAATPATECTLPYAPKINIRPTTAEIEYDITQSAETLTKIKTDTESPYGLGVDTITRGLRHDRPELTYNIKFDGKRFTINGITQDCMWYKDITIDLKLRPRIYIAKENARGDCGEFILKHERKHVAADRIVMNEFAQNMGTRILESVNKMGAVGPFDIEKNELVRQQLIQRIEKIIDEEKGKMVAAMQARQSQIDTLEEYEEGDRICSKHIFD